MASSSNGFKGSNGNFVADGKEKLDLPIGYRFDPTEDQVIEYLKLKIFGKKLPADIIPTVLDVYKLNPEELPLSEFVYGAEHVYEDCLDRVWFFFTSRAETETEGHLLTKDGYWYSEEESPNEIKDVDDTIIGFRRAMEFYRGILGNGIKSEWVIYEHRLNLDGLELDAAEMDDLTKEKVQNFVACRVVFKEKRDAVQEQLTKMYQLRVDGETTI